MRLMVDSADALLFSSLSTSWLNRSWLRPRSSPAGEVPRVSGKFQLAGVQLFPYPAGVAPAANLRVKPCKLPGFGLARHAICTKWSARTAHTGFFDIHNSLNGNVPEDKSPAAQFKLNRGAWNVSIRLLAYASA